MLLNCGVKISSAKNMIKPAVLMSRLAMWAVANGEILAFL